LGFSPTAPKDKTPITDYVQGSFVPISRLMHEWEFHSAITLSPAEERTMVREPVQAIPAAIAQRLGKVRVLAVPYIACLESGDVVCRQKPNGEAHTAAWVETPERINLLLEEEIRHGVRGEIDEDALNAKQAYLPSRAGRRSRAQFECYRDVSFVSTAAEYIHGLWHDVQIRVGPEHLPIAQLRRRMDLMAELFPPNPGYRVFDETVEKAE
jgi:hypothetical protein